MARRLVNCGVVLARGPPSVFLGSRWHSPLAPVMTYAYPLACQYSTNVNPAEVTIRKSGHQSVEDRIDLFANPEVQALLKEITGRDFQRIFRKRKIGQKLKEPTYSFMTEEQLNDAIREANQKADQFLQMPPVLRARKPIDEILSFDPVIQGLEKSTLIFTDISMDISNRDRLIVARDPDGTLRQASWEERDKTNTIYFPREGQEITIPRMLSDPEILKEVLARASPSDNTYEYVLDRTCLQMEPDNTLCLSICETTYDVVDERRHYDYLKSTRHYGPLVFYLVRRRQMDNLLLFNIENQRVSSDAKILVTLFHILFPESRSKAETQGLNRLEDIIRSYIQLDSTKKSELEQALNAYEEAIKNREELEEELEKSHGIQQNS